MSKNQINKYVWLVEVLYKAKKISKRKSTGGGWKPILLRKEEVGVIRQM